MATLNSRQILDRIDSIDSLEVRELYGDHRLLFIADQDRVRKLCADGHVCASSRGRHIRYLELLVPLDEIDPGPNHTERAAGNGCVGEDSRTSQRGEDILANCYSHSNRRCSSYGGSREAYFALGDSS